MPRRKTGAPTDPAELKRKLSPKLLALPFVSGVGVSGDKLAIYLGATSEDAEKKLRALLEVEAPGAAFELVPTGKLMKQ